MASVKGLKGYSLNIFIFTCGLTFFNAIQASNLWKKTYDSSKLGILRQPDEKRLSIQNLIDALAKVGVYFRGTGSPQSVISSYHFANPWANDEDDDREKQASFFDQTPKGVHFKFPCSENQAPEYVEPALTKKTILSNLENPVMSAVPVNIDFNDKFNLKSGLTSWKARKDFSKIMAFMIQNDATIANDVTIFFSQKDNFAQNNIAQINVTFSDESQLILRYKPDMKTWNCLLTRSC